MKHTLVHKTRDMKMLFLKITGRRHLRFKHKKILPSFPQLMKEKIVRNLDKTIQGKKFSSKLVRCCHVCFKCEFHTRFSSLSKAKLYISQILISNSRLSSPSPPPFSAHSGLERATTGNDDGGRQIVI